LKELPAEWRAQAFEKQGALFCLREMVRRDVVFALQDLRAELPDGPHDLIFCRNLAFTYFEAQLAIETLDRLLSRLRPGGALVVGLHDRLPAYGPRLVAWPGCRATYRYEKPP
jgi:chemotaxis protein methyltransferase CheR